MVQSYYRKFFQVISKPVMIQHLLALSDRPAEVDGESDIGAESEADVSSQRKKLKVLNKLRGSIRFDKNVQASASSVPDESDENVTPHKRT